MSVANQSIRFGRFRIAPTEQALYDGNRRVQVGSRAFGILAALLDCAGEVVSTRELLARVWPGVAVEEATLRAQMAALRKILGDGQADARYIINVPGRGYRFVHPVSGATDPEPLPPNETPLSSSRNLPSPLARMVGRDEATGTILGQLSQHRLITIVGAGGIGKTTIAIAVANQLIANYPDGIYFVDLASLAHAGLVPTAVAMTLGLSNLSEDPSAGMIASLRTKRLLLIFDSCEHVVESVALLAEQILQKTQAVHILATSRESLRAQGERVMRLPPLATPPSLAALTARQALEYPAIQLFCGLASARRDDFVLTDANTPAVAEICRRLDGIALAIELVASQVTAFDLPTLAAMLNDRFHLLARGRRTAVPRHQTLRAVIDWSFDAITEDERVVLRRLAVFDSMFDLPTAQSVAADAAITADQVIDLIAGLAEKSLVAVDLTEETARYRLLDTTRAYAQEKLVLSGEQSAVARKHAAYYLAVFVKANTGWSLKTIAEWLLWYSRHLGNVRSALDWAFSDSGDVTLGIRLSAEAVPMMFELSLAEECRRRAMIALTALASCPDTDRRLEMRLRATLAAASMYTPGPVLQTIETWQAVLRIATELDDRGVRSRAFWGLWTAYVYGGAPRKALAYAEGYRGVWLDKDGTATGLKADRIVGVSLHYMGEQAAAQARIERMLTQYDQGRHNYSTLGFQIEHGLMAQATLARILWLRGSPDHALAIRQQTLKDVRKQNHVISVCYVISEAAIPIALLAGDLAGAEREVTALEHLAEQHGIAIWQAEARCTRLALQAVQGIPITIQTMRTALSQLRATGYTAHLTWLSGVMADAPGTQGDAAAKLALVQDALAECDRNEEGWVRAELLRIKAELMALQGPAASREAVRDTLHQALHLARAQGAKSWELRAAISLARLQTNEHHRAEARALVASVLDKFDGGFGTADLVVANDLIETAAG